MSNITIIIHQPFLTLGRNEFLVLDDDQFLTLTEVDIYMTRTAKQQTDELDDELDQALGAPLVYEPDETELHNLVLGTDNLVLGSDNLAISMKV
jgi:hypothetical protein